MVRFASHSVATLSSLIACAVVFCISLFVSQPVSANAARLVASNFAIASATTVSTTLPGVTANNLIVVVCANKNNSTMSVSTPTGFTTGISQSGVPSQAIFYKLAVAGQNTYTCTFNSNARVGIQVFEYSGITTPITGVLTNSQLTTNSQLNTNTITTANSNYLLLGAYISSTNITAPSWSNSFTNVIDQSITNGNGTNRVSIGSLQRFATTTGTYSSIANISATTTSRTQIIGFIAQPAELSISIVNATGTTVASPSFAMTPITLGYQCQTATGTLGVSAQRLRVKNTTTNPAWSLSIAATGGATATWTSSGSTYSYNNGSGAGCTAGQLSIDPSTATIAPQAGCTNTGVTLGSSSSFLNPSQNSITLASGSTGADTGCFWDLTGIALSQTIPAEQPTGTYTLNMTATVVAL